MNSPDELKALFAKVSARFISWVEKEYGEIPEFEEWLESFEFANRHPKSKEADAIATEAFHRLIRTKHPKFICT
jgi:hypothetical protein